MHRTIIKSILNPFVLFYFRFKLRQFIKNNNKDDGFLILDIDNTLCNTWEYLKNKKPNKKVSYADIPLLYKTIEHVKENYSKNPIVFISHRNIFCFSKTNQWIKQNITSKGHLLILVSEPHDKLLYINQILKKNQIVYYDDLSYNHENGKVYYYTKIINEIKKLDLIYYDYQFIKKLNSK